MKINDVGVYLTDISAIKAALVCSALEKLHLQQLKKLSKMDEDIARLKAEADVGHAKHSLRRQLTAAKRKKKDAETDAQRARDRIALDVARSLRSFEEEAEQVCDVVCPDNPRVCFQHSSCA